MMSSTKPEVRFIALSICHQRMMELWLQEKCSENFVKSVLWPNVVFMTIQVDRQTYRHAVLRA